MTYHWSKHHFKLLLEFLEGIAIILVTVYTFRLHQKSPHLHSHADFNFLKRKLQYFAKYLLKVKTLNYAIVFVSIHINSEDHFLF